MKNSPHRDDEAAATCLASIEAEPSKATKAIRKRHSRAMDAVILTFCCHCHHIHFV